GPAPDHRAGRRSASPSSTHPRAHPFGAARLGAIGYSYSMLAVAPPPLVARAPVRTRADDVAFHSNALQRELWFEVFLPPGYDRGGKRYPVVYFLHGLPASSTAYRGATFVAQELERSKRRAILVAPQGAS